MERKRQHGLNKKQEVQQSKSSDSGELESIQSETPLAQLISNHISQEARMQSVADSEGFGGFVIKQTKSSGRIPVQRL